MPLRTVPPSPKKRPARASRTPLPDPPVPVLGALGRVLNLLAEGGTASRRELQGLLLREAMTLAACDEGALLLGRPGELRLEAVQGLECEVWVGEEPLGDPAVAACLAQDKPCAARGAFGHGLALPLKPGPGLTGVLLLCQAKPLSAGQWSAAQGAAQGLSEALAALGPLARRRQEGQRLAAIVGAGAALQKDPEPAAVLERIVREAEALLDAEAGALFLLEPDGALRAAVATGPGGAALRGLRLGPGEGLAGWVARTAEPALVDEAGSDPRVAQRVDLATQHQTRSLAAAPVMLEGRVLGVLEAVNPRGGGRFSPEDLPALQALGVLAGTAIESARAVGALQERNRSLSAELARASLEANEARRRLEGVLFAMEDAVLAADENGLVTLLNRAAQFLSFGLTGQEALGRPLGEVFPDAAFAKAQAEVREALAPAAVELDLGPEEARRTYAVVLAPIRDLEGYLTGFVVVLRDITRFRELERMKTAFLNTVSHELRTPITSIRAFSELMARPGADWDKAREWARVINEEAERLHRLVDDLLDISRIESGKKLSVVRKPTQLKPLFERAMAMQAGSAQTHPIRFRFNEDLTLAELDPDRIQQVVMNLLSNAVKYSPQGGPVDLRVDFAPPAGLRVEVQDRGLGLTEEDRAHVFKKFYRVEGAHMSGIRGTGLGLSICKYLVEAHGGRIGVDSQPGQGSTFWFELPLFAPPVTLGAGEG